MPAGGRHRTTYERPARFHHRFGRASRDPQRLHDHEAGEQAGGDDGPDRVVAPVSHDPEGRQERGSDQVEQGRPGVARTQPARVIRRRWSARRNRGREGAR